MALRSSCARKMRRKRNRRKLHEHWLRFLKEEVAWDRGRRPNVRDLSERRVLSWVDAFFQLNGRWPTVQSGAIPEARGETWILVAAALTLGIRGFKPGRTLADFIEQHRGEKCGAGIHH